MSFDTVAWLQLASVELRLVWVHQSITRGPAQAGFRPERKDNVVAVEVGLDAHTLGIGGHREMHRLTEDNGVREPHALADHRVEHLRFEQEGSGIGPVENRHTDGGPTARKAVRADTGKGTWPGNAGNSGPGKDIPFGSLEGFRTNRRLPLPVRRARPSFVAGNIGGVDDAKGSDDAADVQRRGGFDRIPNRDIGDRDARKAGVRRAGLLDWNHVDHIESVACRYWEVDRPVLRMAKLENNQRSRLKRVSQGQLKEACRTRPSVPSRQVPCDGDPHARDGNLFIHVGATDEDYAPQCD